MELKRYLFTLPERLVRSVVGLGAGVAREVGDLALPQSVRQSRLYQNLVDTTLRFLIEQRFVCRYARFALGAPCFGRHANPLELALEGFLAFAL